MRRVRMLLSALALSTAACANSTPDNPRPSVHADEVDGSPKDGRTTNPSYPRCGTMAPSEETKQTLQARVAVMRGRLAETRLSRLGHYRIPVHFHVINKGAGIENGDIPDDVLNKQIEVLNSDFNVGGERSSAQMPFEFVLASTDRWTNPTWFTMATGSVEFGAKKAIVGEGDTGPLDLHVYTVDALDGNTPVLGWSRYPSDYAREPWRDGVVLQYTSLPGLGEAHSDLGHNATHEVGHWLGLYHPFEGGCSEPGDHVDDTPADKQRQPSDCLNPTPPDTCPSMAGADPIHNYMDYSYDECMNQFTVGQRDLAQAMFELYRLDGS
jgi:hypothetical protein